MALGTRASAAIGAAVAASALIAVLFLGGGRGGGGAAPPAKEASPAAAPPAAAAPMTRKEAAALAAGDPAPPEPPPNAPGPSVEVRVLLDGVQPVPGCPVMGVEKDADGEYLASFGDDGPVSGETGAEGRFVLRWPAEPKERLLAVFLDRGARVGRVEGAAQVGTLSGGQAVLLARGEPVTVHLDDRGGRPRLRILDDAGGRPVDPGVEPVVEWDRTLDDASAGGRVALRHEAAGWWDIGPVPDEATAPRVRAAGFRDHALEDWDRTGRHTVRLAASGTHVIGVLKVPRNLETRTARLTARLVRVDDGDRGSRPPLGRVGAGAFLLDGLEPGEWRLEVLWHPQYSQAAAASWTTKRFAYRGERLDLGTLEAEPGSTLRVRWASTEPLPEGAMLSLIDKRHDMQKGSVDRGWLVSDGPVLYYAPARETDPPAEAFLLFGGLLPGGEYELVCPRIPGWKETVRAPEEPGAERVHEAGRDLRLVKCRLSFTLDGAKAVRPLMIRGPGISTILAGADGVIDCTLPSGRHVFTCQVVDVEQTEEAGVVRLATRGPGFFRVEVEVPDAPEYEATVDLKTK